MKSGKKKKGTMKTGHRRLYKSPHLYVSSDVYRPLSYNKMNSNDDTDGEPDSDQQEEEEHTSIDMGDEDDGVDEEKDSVDILVKIICIGLAIFSLCVVIASVVSIAIVATFQVVQRIAATEAEFTPYRVVNHGIWPGYRHEFFNRIVPFIKAEQVCTSREKSSLLHFNSQEQEDQFDLYVSLNFWSSTDYPAFQVWTSGFVLARRIQTKPIMTVSWPEPNAKGELNVTRECGVRGEGLVNAFSAHEKFWQERHIVKDYIMENQPEGIDATDGGGCWQHVKRNDMAPKSFYRFVCIRKISSIEKLF